MRCAYWIALLMGSLGQLMLAQPTRGDRVTILFDAFTNKPELGSDWGYSALVEFEGKRILFDTGNDAAIFETNVKHLHVDLSRLDFVVLSHRHGDHTAGLNYVLSINPKVRIYAPADEPFRSVTQPAFLTRSADSELPPKMRYFGGRVPSPPPTHGTAWPGVRFENVEKMQEVSEHIHLISTMSETPGFRDMPEVSLVLDTREGPVVMVGCSHPGVENILANLVKTTHREDVYAVIGGMHLVLATPAQLDHTVSALTDRYHVQRMAPGHCSGERLFALAQKRLGKGFVYAGVGEVFS